MSERILRALMQLFAIISIVDSDAEDNTEQAESDSDKGRSIVEAFLKTELNALLVRQYLEMFQEYLDTHHGNSLKKDGARKRTSVNSVKILRICTQINEELTQRQKIIVLLRIFEFIYANKRFTQQEYEFVSTVAETFNVSIEEYTALRMFIDEDQAVSSDRVNLLHVSGKKINLKLAHQLNFEGLAHNIRIIRIESVNIMFFRYFGTDELLLNGQSINNERCYIFNQGASIKTSKIPSLYYSDAVGQYLDSEDHIKLDLRVEHVEYKFKSGKIGIHDLSFNVQSGKLVGIMGGSGAGKSTLLNILNGNNAPTSGVVSINGINIHTEKSKIEGVIGFVSQDDLLIEELTVFQNLFYNARLCFKDLSVLQIEKKVNELLISIGLFEAKDLKVGSPLEKTISGGQRKRLNISLELIREPGVLYLDEPTSGLSSRDSENIIDLLKELALKGKLVFVVIHQPSSDIFKMFDKLMLLDQGGYPIYDGQPIDAVVYFKTHASHVNCDERECSVCGNVNPEQIFNIIEARIVDEFGAATKERKITAEEWNDRYIKQKHTDNFPHETKVPSSTFRIPGKRKQFAIYFKRDVLSKSTNAQYLLLNFLEAPILAVLLGFFVKFFKSFENKGQEYSFYDNANLPPYLFISVVVALFIGLTLAAEEIIRDKKILKRESFLNLSRGSYLASKIIVLFFISAFQTLTFVLVGNLILEIEGMWFEFWLILFSTSCVANLMGLNISAGFNSIKVIYLAIPILIIPQLLFSGVIVKFDKLHPWFAIQDEVPFIGNVMVSRWSYEALAVTQFKHNVLESEFFELNQIKSNAGWKRDYWIPAMKSKIEFLRQSSKYPKKEVDAAYEILANEIRREENEWGNLKCNNCLLGIENKKLEKSLALEKELLEYLSVLTSQFNSSFNKATAEIDAKIAKIGTKKFALMKMSVMNEALSDYATNRIEIDKLVEENHRFIQKEDPIYIEPSGKRFLDAQFYAPNKYFMGTKVDTMWANVIVLWLMGFALTITLYYDSLARLLAWFGGLYERRKEKKQLKNS